MCKTDQLPLKSNSTDFHRFVPSLLFSTTWCFSRSQSKRNSAAIIPAGLSDANRKKGTFPNPKWSIIPCNSSNPLDPNVSQHSPGLPEESWVGKGFISLSTIFWYKALKLKGSTVKGNVPVSMAYMFTPLKENMQKRKPKGSGTRKKMRF